MPQSQAQTIQPGTPEGLQAAYAEIHAARDNAKRVILQAALAAGAIAILMSTALLPLERKDGQARGGQAYPPGSLAAHYTADGPRLYLVNPARGKNQARLGQ